MSKELKPLEALEELKRQIGSLPYTRYDLGGIGQTTTILIKDTGLYDTIETALKALEIIKDCCIVADYKTDDPSTRYELAFCKKICIEKEEYDVLKKILK